jgi:hypothetical protein
VINDSSIWLHHKYFRLKNRKIRIKLKNGKTISGIIHGFYHGDEEKGENRYWMWHIIPSEAIYHFGVDPFGFSVGETINHQNIESIFFEEDQTEMTFN